MFKCVHPAHKGPKQQPRGSHAFKVVLERHVEGMDKRGDPLEGQIKKEVDACRTCYERDALEKWTGQKEDIGA